MEKIKQFIQSDRGKDIMVVLIVVLVGVGSFELGRLSKQNTNAGIKIEYTEPALKRVENQPANAISTTKSSSILQKTRIVTPVPVVVPAPVVKIFFASNRGNKYYPVGCYAGKTIKQENRVYFATREEAEGAGYELSSACD